MESYELASNENLFELYTRIRSCEYTPQTPTRLYYPKASGLQRPFTLLCIEDQIVFQAIANIFEEKVCDRRKPLERKAIFSNWLPNKKGTIFFLNHWSYGYFELRKVLKNWFQNGYSWMVNFDLTAFYETIPHELLIKTIFPRNGNIELTNFFLSCFKTWSTDSKSKQHGHGLPQGPTASDFLSECIMLPIDEEMHETCVYLRYVDDIRILGKTELEVRKSLVKLEKLCRERGLIPSSEKTEILYIKDENQLLENIPPILFYNESKSKEFLSKEDEKQLINESIQSQNNHFVIKDKSKFRFLLFRANTSDEILNIIIKLWKHNPHHIEAFSAFLQNYHKVDEIIQLCIDDVLDNPYDFVKGESWKILSRMCSNEELIKLMAYAVESVKKRDCPAEHLGVYEFLFTCDNLNLGNYSNWIMFEKSSLIQALSGSKLTLTENNIDDLIPKFLHRTIPDCSLSIVKPLIKSAKTLDNFEKYISKKSSVARNVFIKAGLLTVGRRIRYDLMGKTISRRYKIQYWNKWNVLFGPEYSHAYSLLNLAESSFDSFFSSWLSYQDSFNDALFRAFQNILLLKNAPGAISTTTNRGLIDYGLLLNNGNFKNVYPNLYLHLNSIHLRRNKLPSSHPYDKRTNAKAMTLRKNEQRTMKAHMSAAYSEIINICQNLGV